MTQQLGLWLLQAFRQPWVQYLVLPLLAAAVTIVLRSLSRPDRDKLFEIKLEDFLVGIGLGVTGLLTMATTLVKVSDRYAALTADGTSAVQQKIADLFSYVFTLTGFFLASVVALMVMALVMAQNGWSVEEGKAPVPKVGYLVGFDALGLVILAGAIYIMGDLQ